MLTRILLVFSIIALLVGRVPQSVTVCLCTGEVGVAAHGITDICEGHTAPKCEHCNPAEKSPRKGCYATKAKDGPTAAVATTLSLDCPVILNPQTVSVHQFWHPAIEPRLHLSLPRIREPDLSGHQLRAPPTLV